MASLPEDAAADGKITPIALRHKVPNAYPHCELMTPRNHPAGVYFVDVVRDAGEVVGYDVPQFVCSPIRVLSLARDEDGKKWGRLLTFTDPDGREHEWICQSSLHAGKDDDLLAELLDQGVFITPNRKLRAHVGEYIQQCSTTARVRVVERTGWSGGAYVLPDASVSGNPAEPVMLLTRPEHGIGLGVSGTFDEWRELIAKPCIGNSRLVLALSVALAGPCLGLLDAEGGGIHLRGKSSSGKSTAQAVAASVYGKPRDFMLTWRATDNGLEGVAALHTDMLLVLDEIGELDPKHAGVAAYMLANGQGKVRSRKDGTPRATASWRLLFLSSGEVGLSDLVTQVGGRLRAGQEVRVIDFPSDAGVGYGLFDWVPDGMPANRFSDTLKASAAEHHGHALPAMLTALVADPSKARESLKTLCECIACKLVPADAAGQVQRVAGRFALIAAAGEYATTAGITGWSTGEAERAAQRCFNDWLKARGTSGNTETPAMLAQVRSFLSTNGEARFTPWKAPTGAPRTPHRVGFRRDETNGPVYYIDREAFQREICVGFDHHAVVKALTDAGALRTGSKGESTRKERLPDRRRTRVYVIGPELWNGDTT